MNFMFHLMLHDHSPPHRAHPVKGQGSPRPAPLPLLQPQEYRPPNPEEIKNMAPLYT